MFGNWISSLFFLGYIMKWFLKDNMFNIFWVVFMLGYFNLVYWVGNIERGNLEIF